MKFKSALFLFTVSLLCMFSAHQTKAQTNLVITEIMYNNPYSDSLEFIEIYNKGASAINLNGYKLRKAVSFTFPAITINAGQYVVVCGDSMAFFRQFHQSAPQWTSGALSNQGDSVFLFNTVNIVQDYVVYQTRSPWPTVCDGGGPSMVLCDPTTDNSLASNWTYSNTPAGITIIDKEVYADPGAGCALTDGVPPIPFKAKAYTTTSVLVQFNERVTNATATNIANYTGIGTVSSAVLTTSQDSVWLTLSTPLNVGQYYTLSVSSITDLNSNTMPRPRTFSLVFNNTVTPIVIDEIFYNDPFSPDTIPFVEITNNSSAPVQIGGYEFKLGILYQIPQRTLAAHEYIVLTKDTALFRSIFGVPAAFQWESGSLSNAGEPIVIYNTLGTLIDSVPYGTSLPWDTMANGYGPSLVICPSNLSADNTLSTTWTHEVNLASHIYSFNGQTIIASPGMENCNPSAIENVSTFQMDIYPNPFRDQLMIRNYENRDLSIEMTDISGKLLLKETVHAGNSVLATDTILPGVYFIRVTNQGKTDTHKFIKL